MSQPPEARPGRPSPSAPEPAASPARPGAASAAPAASAASAAPAVFPPAVARTISWLQSCFGRWYEDHPVPLPDRHTRREFGFILWPERPGPPPFIRHRAYPDGGGLHRHMARVGPHSAYYSTAYYRRPGESRMADKQWLGAELIFDLDADHLVEAEKAKAEGRELAVEDQLRLVKDQFRRLLDEFLMGDLGLSEKDLWITFSGGRGYHCHVTHPAYMALDNRARREIVDYVTGKAPVEKGKDTPELSLWIRQETVGVRGHGDWAKPVKGERIAPAGTPGWPGRMTRTLVDELRHNVLLAHPEQAQQWLLGIPGIGPKSAAALMRKLDEAMLERIANGFVDQGVVVRHMCRRILQTSTIPLAKGETDEPVTADVKRLIRLPGSLHGKTGLKVVVLDRDSLDRFEPLRDAVAFPLDESVRITPRADMQVRLAGETVRVEKGVALDVPVPHAVWVCARQGGALA